MPSHYIILCCWLAIVPGLTAGAAVAQEIGGARSPLLTDVSQADDCSPEEQRFNDDIMRHGRIAAVTRAFEQCVDAEVRARYRECQGDPFYDDSRSVQISRVLDVSRSTNRVHIFCTGGEGNASAPIGDYGHLSDEAFSWGGWFGGVFDELEKSNICTAAEQQDPNRDCRWAVYPWPYSQAAGVVWHEVMHTHGYGHGANEQPPADRNCGYEGDATWHFQVNTMPYILGSCIDEVLTRSGQRCGRIASCPSPNQLRIIDGYDSSDCSCVADPGAKGLGILSVRSGDLTDAAILPAEDWVGGWHYGSRNRVAATGDFDGNGSDDLLLTSEWGIGILTYDSTRWRQILAKPKGTRFGAWNYQGDRIQGIGDFNGDGKDDVVLTSTWGIGILTLRGASMDALLTQPKGTRFGAWNYQGDPIQGIGDFNGDGKDDLVVRSAWGVGLLRLQASSMMSFNASPYGDLLGSWLLESDDRMAAVADLDSNPGADLLLQKAH